MPNDSTELTFVRCPSCRSLVPAMSTRCRMCGASLDASEKPQARKSEKKSGRVRQRTMSRPGDSAMVRQARADSSDAAGSTGSGDVKAGDPAEVSKPADLPVDDPLRDFIQEVPVDSKIETGASKQSSSNGENAALKNKETVEESSEPLQVKQEVEQVVVEAGRGKAGLSFGKKGEGKSTPKDEPLEDVFSEPVSPKPETAPKKAAKTPEPKPETPREKKKPESQTSADAEEEFQPEAGKKEVPKISVKSKKGVSHDGRLFGWLVNYANPDGEAIEVREGKFFITREALKKRDLIVDDESVSTPHAVAIAAAETGFEVQDLMSDRGLFVRRRKSDVYHKEEDRLTLEHGDWVRFGDVEFLVCLIAHLGEK